MSVEVVDHEPVRPVGTQLRLGGRRLDLTARAVVVGLVGVSADRVEEASVLAASACRDGAVAVELAGPPEVLHAVLSDLRGRLDLPVPLGCRVESLAALQVAAGAAVELVTLADDALVEPLAELMDGGTAVEGAGASAASQRWAPAVVAAPGALLRLRTLRPGGDGALAGLVADPAASAASPVPFASTGPVPGAQERWVRGATVEAVPDEVAVTTTLAVLDGARLVRTTSVRSARRASDLVAALLQERWGRPG